MKTDKLLIINADDFGYDAQTNETVEELILAERITSVSMLACTTWSDDAAERAKRHGFSVGAHLALTSDDAQHPWTSLTNSFGGHLPADAKALMLGARRQGVQRELNVQFDFLINHDLHVDHTDGHSGALYGLCGRRFYLDAFDLCAEKGLPFRLPKAPGFFSRQLGGRLPGPLKAFHAHLVKLALNRGVSLPDDVVSDPRNPAAISTRDSLFSYYLSAVQNCMPGVTEVFLHPRKADAEHGSPWEKRLWEFELLASGELLLAAERNGITVVSPEEAYDLDRVK